eukprot:CAMPEP_0172640446 /NCGR_PEP_ID=MMETSP1068-20121228/223045_1 /TAXON_ID=35684 /ORGANISM="Pseudopedinella elastica, Strain CCMP716" /LENGTH=78 /DNA_ID=CAMNT_0013453823 /DNA_START=196 /DNA_END=432 /DNA_ORIENTATION=+
MRSDERSLLELAWAAGIPRAVAPRRRDRHKLGDIGRIASAALVDELHLPLRFGHLEVAVRRAGHYQHSGAGAKENPLR